MNQQLFGANWKKYAIRNQAEKICAFTHHEAISQTFVLQELEKLKQFEGFLSA